MTGSPTISGIATTYNGTAIITMQGMAIPNVPVSIKLMGNRAMSLWIDPTKTEGHFGNTPIYGIQQVYLSEVAPGCQPEANTAGCTG